LSNENFTARKMEKEIWGKSWEILTKKTIALVLTASENFRLKNENFGKKN
jgi:hypothetical protein